MKPMLMNTEMVKAILAGRKTVTRRLIKERHLCVLNSPYHKEHSEVPDKVLLEKLCESPYQPGDVLYVRETWCNYAKLNDFGQVVEGTEKYYFLADGENPTPFNDFLVQHDGWDEHRDTPVWHPSIHMPKEAARIFLRVTKVRAERLQEITTDDIWYKEGIPFGLCIAPYDGFARLWNSTIKKADLAKYGWDANPWVWVIEFERISKEEAMKNA